jgi:hypothetical protein
MWPEFVDRCMIVKSVRYVRVEVADQEKLAYTLLTVAYSNTFSDRTIIWQENLAPETERRTHVAFENGHWISRDGSGRICDVH